MEKKYINRGATILFVIFGLLFFVLFSRLFLIEYKGEADGQPLSAKAQKRYLQQKTLAAQRGSILDKNGNIIAEDTSSYILTAILDPKVSPNPDKPQHVADPEKTAAVLAKHIAMPEDEIYKILTKKGAYQVEFGTAGRGLTHTKKQEIESLSLPGIMMSKDNKRFYPNGVFASHVIGFVEKNFDEANSKTITTGVLGLEKELDSFMQEQNGKVNYEGDRWGNILPSKTEKVTAPKNGASVYVTLDKKIQTFLEDSMNQVDKEYSPSKMVAIVADPKTGQILAMAQRPTFNMNTRVGLDKTWHNFAIEESFEPGSTMKIFTLAAAVEEGVFTPNEQYQSGSYAVKGSGSIHDHNYSGWGKITYLEGVQRSSNVGFAKLVMEKLGADKFREYITKFGLDKVTGIDLPFETAGKVVFKYDIEKVTTAFGQGTAVTPIQQVQAATAIANDGKMMKPFVLKKVVNSNTGEVLKETEPHVSGKPISAETAKKVRDILETVVTAEKGTGKPYFIEGYDVIGKTGTAQIPDPKGGYLEGYENYIYSFLGMAPKDDPQVIIYVAVQQPKLDEKQLEAGSMPVSKIFKPVMENTLKYLNIKPNDIASKQERTISEYSGLNVASASTELKRIGLIPVVIGKGKKITAQLPEKGTKLIEGEKLLLLTDGELTMPDVSGWSVRDVMKFASLTDVKLHSTGEGYAVQQQPKPNSVFSKKDKIVVDFESPQETINKTINPPKEKKNEDEVIE